MKAIVNILLCKLFLLVAIGNGIAKPHFYQTQPKKANEVILAKVKALPEVNRFMETAKSSKPELLIGREPDAHFKYYWVKVGLTNLDMFRTTFDFCVDPKTYKVNYWDLLDKNQSMITLAQWRNLRTSPGFSKPHSYKKDKKGKLILVSKK